MQVFVCICIDKFKHSFYDWYVLPAHKNIHKVYFCMEWVPQSQKGKGILCHNYEYLYGTTSMLRSHVVTNRAAVDNNLDCMKYIEALEDEV